MRILGLDVGTRRIGVALSDPLGISAQPLKVIEREGWDADLAKIRALVREWEVSCVVVGMPRSLNGSLGPQARMVEEFVAKLRDAIGVPVDTWDERLTTVAAERAMLEANVRRDRRRQRVDAVAAALLLQAYLDSARRKAP
ncbi:MAG: Holliday junction resolvase RuvX [Armatimonadota bacterium]|nr:Holliday junction resolvase RuvX [Armatimonadota bacterium]MDR5702929.1 Holliday junction resolvase RuvX [Armatimonadota bacterium]